MSDLELSLDWAISTDTSLCFRKWSLNVTQNVCNFARTVVSLCHDFSVLNTPYLHKMLDSFMTEVWNEVLRFSLFSQIFTFHLHFSVSQTLILSTCF